MFCRCQASERCHTAVHHQHISTYHVFNVNYLTNGRAQTNELHDSNSRMCVSTCLLQRRQMKRVLSNLLAISLLQSSITELLGLSACSHHSLSQRGSGFIKVIRKLKSDTLSLLLDQCATQRHGPSSTVSSCATVKRILTGVISVRVVQF